MDIDERWERDVSALRQLAFCSPIIRHNGICLQTVGEVQKADVCRIERAGADQTLGGLTPQFAFPLAPKLITERVGLPDGHSFATFL